MKILSLVGARPNFMKIAPFIRAIRDYNMQNGDLIEHVLVHSGQHYDSNMSDTFFEALKIPYPDINLEIGSGSHAEQVGKTMIAFENVLIKEKPDWVVVVGDVNATLAGSVTAKKLHIKVAHIEAGLRSGDERMPEEINRLVTDTLSDLLLTPDKISSNNLRKEGVDTNKIVFVGNIMIDTLEGNKSNAEKLNVEDIIKDNLISESSFASDIYIDKFALMTLHRPSNVDKIEILRPIIDYLINKVSNDQFLIWPIHPRTKSRLFELWDQIIQCKRLILLNPLGYLEMLKLNMNAKIVLTDSGGLQEECTVLGTPCLTLRWNTERPITLLENGGVSILVGNDIERIKNGYTSLVETDRKPTRPELWDGGTADRILNQLIKFNQ